MHGKTKIMMSKNMKNKNDELQCTVVKTMGGNVVVILVFLESLQMFTF